MNKLGSLKKFIHSRLGRKLLFFILSNSIFFTLLGAGIQMCIYYRIEVNTIKGRMDQIQHARLSTLARALWYLDQELLLIQLDSLLELKDVKSVYLTTPDGQEIFRGKRADPNSLWVQRFPLVFQTRDHVEQLGTLFVNTDKTVLYVRLAHKILSTLIAQGALIFFVSLILLYLVVQLITRHLGHMAEYVTSLDLEKQPEPLILDKTVRKKAPDEIDQVVFAFNTMLENLKQNMEQRTLAETRLRQVESSLRDILDSMPSVLVTVDKDGSITRKNRQIMTITGLSQQNTIASFFAKLCPQALEQQEILSAIAANTPHKFRKIPYVQDDQTLFYDIVTYPLSSGEGAVVRLDDVTQAVRLEEIMIQSEKMLSVSGLAAGMAHEINNPLAVILQSLQVLRNRLTKDLPANQSAAQELGLSLEQLRAYLEMRDCMSMLDSLAQAGQRAAKIVADMLSFSRKSSAHFTPVDIPALLDQTVELATNDYNLKKHYDFRHIKIVRDYAEHLAPVPCDQSKIQQVFFNLIQNAAQAMASSGTRGPCLTLRIRQDNQSLRMEIKDNGPGIPEKIRRRVFEPFFTTKTVGEGTGLGLSISYFIIVENHGGSLDVHSIPGQGSTFIITLPRTPK